MAVREVLLHCKNIALLFWQPPFWRTKQEEKKQQPKKNTKAKIQIIFHQTVSHFFFFFSLHTLADTSTSTSLFHRWSAAVGHAAFQYSTHSPCTRGFQNLQGSLWKEVLHSKPAPGKKKLREEREEREPLYGSKSTTFNKDIHFWDKGQNLVCSSTSSPSWFFYSYFITLNLSLNILLSVTQTVFRHPDEIEWNNQIKWNALCQQSK